MELTDVQWKLLIPLVEPTRPASGGTGVAPSRFVNDGKQVFVKVSYLFRY